MNDPHLSVPFPWELVEERDRGYESACWDAAAVGIYRRRRLLHALVGPTTYANRTCLMHLCEIYGEKNTCVRPDHVRIATPSENVAHSYERRRAAGEPRTQSTESNAKRSAALKGQKRAPYGPHSKEHKAKISAALKGRPKSAETRAKMSAAQRRRHQ